MPLIKCPECGKDVSTKAPSCPHCGFPLGNTGHPTAPSPTSTVLQEKQLKDENGPAREAKAASTQNHSSLQQPEAPGESPKKTSGIGKRGWLGVIVVLDAAWTFINAEEGANEHGKRWMENMGSDHYMVTSAYAKAAGYADMHSYLVHEEQQTAGTIAVFGAALIGWGFWKYGRKAANPVFAGVGGASILPVGSQDACTTTGDKGNTKPADDDKATDDEDKTELPSRDAASPSVEEIVARHGAGIKDSRIWFAPNIPAKKLQGAIRSYASGVSPGDVLMLLDNTCWGGCGDGMLITRDRLYGHDVLESPKVIRISEIKTADTGGFFGRGVFINGSKLTPFQN